jgi:hypothetical protein
MTEASVHKMSKARVHKMSKAGNLTLAEQCYKGSRGSEACKELAGYRGEHLNNLLKDLLDRYHGNALSKFLQIFKSINGTKAPIQLSVIRKACQLGNKNALFAFRTYGEVNAGSAELNRLIAHYASEDISGRSANIMFGLRMLLLKRRLQAAEATHGAERGTRDGSDGSDGSDENVVKVIVIGSLSGKILLQFDAPAEDNLREVVYKLQERLHEHGLPDYLPSRAQPNSETLIGQLANINTRRFIIKVYRPGTTPLPLTKFNKGKNNSVWEDRVSRRGVEPELHGRNRLGGDESSLSEDEDDFSFSF